MANYTKEFLSGSTDGAPIDVAATATPGTLIHTAHATSKDEVWIYAFNTTGSSRTLTVEFGGTAGKDTIILNLGKSGIGLQVIVPGGLLTNGLVVRAFADVANDVSIIGWVNRVG